MRKDILRNIRLLTLSVLMLLCTPSLPALTTVNGVVVDSLSGEPMPFISILQVGSNEGVITNKDGVFTISTSVPFTALRVSAVGYTTKDVPIVQGQHNTLDIKLSPSTIALSEVLVRPGKEKYKKKGNPAVAFAERLIKVKHRHDPKRDRDWYTYDKYEKMSFGFNNFEDVEKKNFLLKKFDFLFEYMDTSEITGKRILPISTQEKVSQEYFRRSPSGHKEYVTGMKHAGLDENFDKESVKRFLDDVFREIDIFDGNDVTFMQNRFVSPLSNIGTNFYRYYLDTVMVDSVRCIDLTFLPFNTQSFGFLGHIYVADGDSTLFVRKIKLSVPRSINLNYVQHVYIEQDYKRAVDGSRLKMRDDMTVEFQIMPGTQGLYARRQTLYSAHSFAEPGERYQALFNRAGEQIIAPDAQYMPQEFWSDNRPAGLKNDETTMRRMIARLRQSKLFYWGEKVIVTLVSGYVKTNGKDSKFDFGPMNTTISGNQLEGVRLRVGGMTTANLSRNWFSQFYVAYGTKDEKFKYMGQLEYSFNKKKYHSNEFPIHSIRLMHRYDVDKLGQHYLYTNPDNVFLVLKRQKDMMMTYLRRTELEYRIETRGGWSVSLGFTHDIHEASRYIAFNDGHGEPFKRYTEAGFNVALRFAPGEKFYQTRSYRIPINLDAPIITLSHTYVPKGFMGSKYEVNKTELGVQKRFWFSAFGYTDIILKAGKVWSTVAFPDLLLPNANLSYTIQPESYTLMSPMEFVNDQYLSWDVTYWANGLIMNRIPLVKYLKLREVFSFRGLYGRLSDKNNPALNSDLLQFPEDAICMVMGNKPYMEVGVGLDNIFTFLRVDYVWRVTYRDTPGVNRGGFRIQLHFTF